MGKEGEDALTNTETWNIAAGYVMLKVLHPLVECDKLEKIALFGSESIEQAFMLTPSLKIEMRIDAIHRFTQTLNIILENTFRLLKSPAIKDAESIKTRLETVEQSLAEISFQKSNSLTKVPEKQINEKHFSICMNILRKIKTDITKPLKISNLIFPPGDELDLESIKDKLVHGG